MYKIDIDPEARGQISGMPTRALVAMAEVLALLEVAPWSGGEPHHRANPDEPMRRVMFGGAGILVYLILEDQRRVDVLRVMWIG